MKISYRLPLAMLAAAVLLTSLTASASARQFRLNALSFRAVWSEPLTITDPTLGTRIRCRPTFEGIFHSSVINKVIGTLIGLITSATVVHPCVGEGEMWIHNGTEAPLGVVKATSLPWHITYQGFRGALPEIITMRVLLRGIRITGVGKLFGAVVCLAIFGNATESIMAEFFVNEAKKVFALSISEQFLRRRETIIAEACPETLRLDGSATTITQLNSALDVSLTLI